MQVVKLWGCVILLVFWLEEALAEGALVSAALATRSIVKGRLRLPVAVVLVLADVRGNHRRIHEACSIRTAYLTSLRWNSPLF